MAYKTLIFGIDDMFRELQPFYIREVQRGNLEIVAYAVLENNGIRIVDTAGRPGGGNQFQLAIISSQNDFYRRMKFLEAQGFPHNRIIDGRVFRVPNLDFPRLLNEGVAYGFLKKSVARIASYTVHPQIYDVESINTKIILGRKSYIETFRVDCGDAEISVGNFTSIGWEIIFSVGLSADHNPVNVTNYSNAHLDWHSPPEFLPPQGTSKILIGNDVWIGKGSNLKATNPLKPLIIGDGAVVASDSVVVKNVPPYAIVGGNPAQIIKYRFPPHVIEALLRIKWWDWDIDKIHDNFKYFNNVEKFISLHDKED